LAAARAVAKTCSSVLLPPASARIVRIDENLAISPEEGIDLHQVKILAASQRRRRGAKQEAQMVGRAAFGSVC
jgi:hypothetical protein